MDERRLMLEVAIALTLGKGGNLLLLSNPSSIRDVDSINTDLICPADIKVKVCPKMKSNKPCNVLQACRELDGYSRSKFWWFLHNKIEDSLATKWHLESDGDGASDWWTDFKFLVRSPRLCIVETPRLKSMASTITSCKLRHARCVSNADDQMCRCDLSRKINCKCSCQQTTCGKLCNFTRMPTSLPKRELVRQNA